MQEVPLFRRAVSEGGRTVVSDEKAVQYTTIHHQNLRLGRSAGFPDATQFYCYRRGGGEAIDGEHLQCFHNN